MMHRPVSINFFCHDQIIDLAGDSLSYLQHIFAGLGCSTLSLQTRKDVWLFLSEYSFS